MDILVSLKEAMELTWPWSWPAVDPHRVPSTRTATRQQRGRPLPSSADCFANKRPAAPSRPLALTAELADGGRGGGGAVGETKRWQWRSGHGRARRSRRWQGRRRRRGARGVLRRRLLHRPRPRRAAARSAVEERLGVLLVTAGPPRRLPVVPRLDICTL
ncbi:Protein of unknown function, partial [Gryllus bimaculatus]